MDHARSAIVMTGGFMAAGNASSRMLAYAIKRGASKFEVPANDVLKHLVTTEQQPREALFQHWKVTFGLNANPDTLLRREVGLGDGQVDFEAETDKLRAFVVETKIRSTLGVGQASRYLAALTASQPLMIVVQQAAISSTVAEVDHQLAESEKVVVRHGGDWTEFFVTGNGLGGEKKRIIVTSWRFAVGIEGVDSLMQFAAAVESIEPDWVSDFEEYLTENAARVGLQWITLGDALHEVLLKRVKDALKLNSDFTVVPEKEHQRRFQMVTITSRTSGACAYIGYDLPTFADGNQTPYFGRIASWPEATLGTLPEGANLTLRPLRLSSGRSRQENLEGLIDQGLEYARDFEKTVDSCQSILQTNPNLA